jgi:hypothetical protein
MLRSSEWSESAWSRGNVRLATQRHDEARRQELALTVVPDSASADLKRLGGRMTIHIVQGKHSYQFDYPLEK